MNDSREIDYSENGKLFTGIKNSNSITYHFGDDGICNKINAIAMKNKCTVARDCGFKRNQRPKCLPCGNGTQDTAKVKRTENRMSPTATG